MSPRTDRVLRHDPLVVLVLEIGHVDPQVGHRVDSPVAVADPM